jgi:hypothetical protein
MRENLTYGLKRQGVETRMKSHLRRHPLTLQADGSLVELPESPQLSLSVSQII